jgi:hypothetical protein
VGCCYAAGAIVPQCHNCPLHNTHAPGTCLPRRCPGNMYVFLFLGSCNCSIVVVCCRGNVFAEQLPENDCLFWPYYWLEFTRGRVCVLQGSRPTIRGGENL